MTTPSFGGSSSDNDKKDPVLDSLINQIKSNYMENVEIDQFIEYDKSKEKGKASIQIENLKAKLKSIEPKIWVTMLITAMVTVLLAFGAFSLFSNNSSTSTTQSTEGQLPLTEAELKSVVANLNSVVYWVGPLDNAKYTLDVTDAGAAFVRYLPNGEGANDTAKNYLIVATYRVNAAYDAIKTAGNEQDGIGLMTSDGAAVYYNKNAATNVYMAYPGQDLQIEVFDPSPGKALQLVNTTGLVKPIR
jgi:hypothetical protein